MFPAPEFDVLDKYFTGDIAPSSGSPATTSHPDILTHGRRQQLMAAAPHLPAHTWPGAPAGGPPAPACRRDTGSSNIKPAGAYQRAEPVWIWRDQQWRPGITLQAGPYAVTIRYRTGPQATGVDTATAHEVTPRSVPDPVLDQPTTPGGQPATREPTPHQYR